MNKRLRLKAMMRPCYAIELIYRPDGRHQVSLIRIAIAQMDRLRNYVLVYNQAKAQVRQPECYEHSRPLE